MKTEPDDKQFLYRFYSENGFTFQQVDTYLPLLKGSNLNKQEVDYHYHQILEAEGESAKLRIKSFIKLFSEYKEKLQASILEEEERKLLAEIHAKRRKQIIERLQEISLSETVRTASSDDQILSAHAASPTSFDISNTLEKTTSTHLLQAKTVAKAAPIPTPKPNLEAPKPPRLTSRNSQ